MILGTMDPALLVSRVGIEPTRKTGRQRSNLHGD